MNDEKREREAQKGGRPLSYPSQGRLVKKVYSLRPSDLAEIDEVVKRLDLPSASAGLRRLLDELLEEREMRRLEATCKVSEYWTIKVSE